MDTLTFLSSDTKKSSGTKALELNTRLKDKAVSKSIGIIQSLDTLRERNLRRTLEPLLTYRTDKDAST